MRRSTVVLRIAALAGAAALVALSAGPGAAAQPLASGTAVGLTLTVGGTTNNTGSYAVSNDGSGETSTGSRDPQIRVLGGQTLLNGGTLAQNAATSEGGTSVVACAGLAGDGATVVEVGDGDCLRPGNQLQLNAANVDLSNISVVGGEALAPLSGPLDQVVDPLRGPVLQAISDGLADALTQLGDPGVFLDLGAIQSTCGADGGGAAGDATLADAALYVQLPGQRVDLVRLPVNPPPNTKLLTDLQVVVDTFKQALQTQLESGLQGALAGASGPVSDAIDQINANVISQVAPQLAPLEENVLDGILNKQVRPRDRAIEVTALEVQVLPAAREQVGGDLLSAKIGAVTCATADAVAPPAPPAAPPGTPRVPTSVPSGLADAPADDAGLPAEVALAGLVLVAGAVGVTAYRRRLTD